MYVLQQKNGLHLYQLVVVMIMVDEKQQSEQDGGDGSCNKRYERYSTSNNKDPLCLSRSSWKTLSSGALSSRNSRDVQAVQQGIHFAKEQSGGLVINVMARDTIDAMEDLRYNVESLLPFFENKLAVVVYENDSVDGTREAFKQWAQDASGYTIDLMNCGAKLPVFALLIAAFFAQYEALIMFMITLGAWAGALLVAKLLRVTVIKGSATPFVMELPPYRMPTFKGLAIHTWERTWQYVKKAGTIIN